MRAVVERCQHRGPKMHTLVTLGGQHQGVMNVPLCWNPSFNTTNTYVCRAMQSVVGWGAYLPFIRNHVIQAQYFKVRLLASARLPALLLRPGSHLQAGASRQRSSHLRNQT